MVLNLPLLNSSRYSLSFAHTNSPRLRYVSTQAGRCSPAQVPITHCELLPSQVASGNVGLLFSRILPQHSVFVFHIAWMTALLILLTLLAGLLAVLVQRGDITW